MGCFQIAKQIEQALGCGQHVVRAEFSFLTSNFEGQLTRRGGVARDISTVGQSQDGIGKLDAWHSSEPDWLITALAVVTAS